jgi:phosphoglycolate phosphatase
MKKYSCIIFDLDGTLADTVADIAAATNHALSYNNFSTLPLEAYPGLLGWGMKKLAQKALLQILGEAKTDSFEETADRIAGDIMRFYTEEPLVHTKPYPGIKELLAELRQKKLILAVLSNKPDPLARVVVDGLFPERPFACVQGERPGLPGKPDPASVWDILAELDKKPADTIFAGDSEIDIQTARSAGCYPLGLSWGFRPRGALEEAGAARIIDRPGELLELIR